MSEVINPVEDLFEDFSEEVTPTEAVTPPETSTPPAKKSRKKKAEELKAEIAGVVMKHEATVETMKAVEMKDVVVIDLLNHDDRVKIVDLMREGKTLTDMGRAFIPAFLTYPPFNPNNPPVHKIYIDDIKHISVRTYYQDLTLMEAGSRTIVRNAIWTYHEGYHTSDMITQEQLDYLLDNELIKPKQVFYSHSDVYTGESFYLDTDPSEPTLDFINKTRDVRIKEAAKVKANKYGDSPVEEITDQVTDQVTDQDTDQAEEVSDQEELPQPVEGLPEIKVPNEEDNKAESQE